jgi:predicted N-acetyltransferase YhbS
MHDDGLLHGPVLPSGALTAFHGLAIERMVDDDVPSVLGLLEAALGWGAGDTYARFFRWKHTENPFGASTAWVARDGDGVVAVRIFLRWQFERDGARVDAVRAVDTATSPQHQRKGIFRSLTLAALDEVEAEGVAFVFNTPNEQSGAGNLTLGWQVVGRPPVSVQPRLAVGSLRRLSGARAAATKWSEPSSAGVDAREAFEDRRPIAELLASQPRLEPGQLRTARSPTWYRWRFCFPELAYRVLPLGADLAEGFAVARLRRRGGATEAAVVDVLVPGGVGATAARALRGAARAMGADYALFLGAVDRRSGFVPFPRQGPIMTWRAVADDAGAMPPLDRWRLTLADIELF